MPVQRFAAILRARWITVAAVWLGAIAIAVLASVLLTAQYKAVGKLMVESKTVDPAAGFTLPGATPNHIPTEIDVVQSERVALRALHALNLQKNEQWKKRWQDATGGRGSYEAWVAEQLLKKFDVRPSRESNVLTIAFTSPDPEFSAKVVNAFTQAYIDTSVELQMEPARESNVAFDETSKRLRANLEKAQQKLSQFQQRTGLVATDERLDVENMRLAELSTQVVTLQVLASNTAGRQRQVAANPERLPEVMNDPLVSALRAELSKQEAGQSVLASRLGDRHPTVIEMTNSIAELRARIGRAEKRASASVEAENKVAGGRLAEAQKWLEDQRAKVLRLKANRDEAQVLQREVENAQRAYDSVLTRSTQTALEGRGARANVSVLKVATPPALAAWPKPWLNIGAAAVIGLLLAIVIALLREGKDARLRSLVDVPERLGQPVLLSLGGPKAPAQYPLQGQLPWRGDPERQRPALNWNS